MVDVITYRVLTAKKPSNATLSNARFSISTLSSWHKNSKLPFLFKILDDLSFLSYSPLHKFLSLSSSQPQSE